MPAKMIAFGRRAAVRGRAMLRREEGITAIEFAIVAPVLILLFLGAFELGRFLWLEVKVDRVAVSLGDLVSRENSASEDLIGSMFDASTQIMLPFATGGLSSVVITSISPKSATDLTPTINWQRSGGGTLTQISRVAPCNGSGPVVLPPSLTLAATDVVIVTEMFYSFTPVTGEGIMSPTIVYRDSFFKPRITALSSISGSPGYPGTGGSGKKCT